MAWPHHGEAFDSSPNWSSTKEPRARTARRILRDTPATGAYPPPARPARPHHALAVRSFLLGLLSASAPRLASALTWPAWEPWRPKGRSPPKESGNPARRFHRPNRLVPLCRRCRHLALRLRSSLPRRLRSCRRLYRRLRQHPRRRHAGAPAAQPPPSTVTRTVTLAATGSHS